MVQNTAAGSGGGGGGGNLEQRDGGTGQAIRQPRSTGGKAATVLAAVALAVPTTMVEPAMAAGLEAAVARTSGGVVVAVCTRIPIGAQGMAATIGITVGAGGTGG